MNHFPAIVSIATHSPPGYVAFPHQRHQQPPLNFLAVRLTHFVDRPGCGFD
ncbi:hypothetical protein NDI47_22575 [Microcoleus vaginatus GB1-A2]|uniref:hypothetical protein n=1 Tax=Microcoleus vaginatus TaxID=119532 RepID=UPI001683CBEC|nr:hypothetical protein [Microcoleus sp. FACHB-61]